MTAAERDNPTGAGDPIACGRDDSPVARDRAADARDRRAEARDRAAEVRDRARDARDARIASLNVPQPTQWRRLVNRSWIWAARDRQRVESDQARPALRRVDGSADRERAARDRALAARDRVLAAKDRAQAAAERKADEFDALTGARRRAPGLAEIQHEIDRAHRGTEGSSPYTSTLTPSRRPTTQEVITPGT